jgi:hypothetical protein
VAAAAAAGRRWEKTGVIEPGPMGRALWYPFYRILAGLWMERASALQ